ncbi:hypothetical protein KKC94_00330 [Patescibacteria group bacterium]|nr:hypothetical protein [Patescibacteria group bacterium]
MRAKVVHIAGSKGKGTVAWLISEGLRASGFKVGLFSSPFILSEEEMIRINGVSIPRKRLDDYLEKVQIGKELSEFEALTEAAFLCFEEEECDYIILECGWGGKMDATNRIEKKDLTILTHIELEHMEVLGDTLKKITLEKLGICRPGVPLLTASSQDAAVMQTIEDAGFKVEIAPSAELNYHNPESTGLALFALEKLGVVLDSKILDALAKLIIPGRFEVLKMDEHVLILDGAHTYDSIRSLEGRVLTYAQEHGLPLPLWAIHTLKDKPKDLWTLFPIGRTVWLELDHPRASTPPDQLPKTTVEQLLSELKLEETPKLVVFTGSFRVVAEVRKGF